MSIAAFLTALFTLILIPRQATRAAQQLLVGTRERPDTVALMRHLDRLTAQVAAVDSVLERHRARAEERARHPAAFDSLLAASAEPPAKRARRDSLATAIDELSTLLARAERAPLSASYRALGDARALEGDPRVRMLLDSLADLSRARDAFSAAGGVDPIFVALTSRLTAVGHDLEAAATAKRAALRAELATLGPPPAPPAALIAAADTLGPLARIDSIQRIRSAIVGALGRARRIDADLDARTEEAQSITNASAPPLALMMAALVLGAAVGFAVTFGFELSTPRVADAAEAARVAGVPTLATIAPQPPDPRRMRRAADRALSPLIAASSQVYRYLYSTLADPRAAVPDRLPLVAITGDEASIIAAVAANIAVAGAQDSRSTLLIDADPEAASVSSILAVRRAPGVTDVLSERTDWAAVILSAVVGRDRTLDVIPAGTHPRDAALPSPSPSPSTDVVATRASAGAEHPDGGDASAGVAAAGFRDDLTRLGRRYDLIVVGAPAGAVQVGPGSVLPASDAVVCARVAYTTLARLGQSVATLHDSGLRVRGVVLWDADAAPRIAAQAG